MSKQDKFLTPEGRTKLESELNDLKNIKRKEIAKRINEAKELGDLSENAEYTEAKNDQAFMEGRIIEVESILRQATVIKHDPKTSSEVEVGSKITTNNGKENEEYSIVGSNEADPAKGKISHESPIGQAFLGKKIGDIIEIKVPQGSKKFKIITIS